MVSNVNVLGPRVLDVVAAESNGTTIVTIQGNLVEVKAIVWIDNDIYSIVDACPNACEMWRAIERNQCNVTIHQVNVQFLLQLQPEWQRGKAIVNSPQPIYDQEPSMVAEDDKTSKDKEIDKHMALISLSFKKIYKPTNNNLRTSSNTSRANQDNSPRISRSAGYENQRIGNVPGARETVDSTAVQKSGIQCYNCKKFGHVARECQKPKRVKDDAYHRENMLLCKQEEAVIQLNAEQADWRDDNAADSGPIFDDEPLQKVSNDDHYNVFAMESKHSEQYESVHDTYPIDQDAHNVIIDSLDMSYDTEEINQNDDDNDLANERELLASLIEKLKCEIDESKNRNKFLETSNKVLIEKLKAPESDEVIRLEKESRLKRINAGLAKFHKCLNEEMVANLRYFNSLELEVDSLRSQLETQKTQFLNEIDRLSREYYYADHMNVICGVYAELDEVTNLQCDYLELLEKCEGLETELSKSKMIAERIACTANPLALVTQQQPVYHPQTHPTYYTQNSSTRPQQATTKNRGKAIINSPQPIYDQEPSMVAEDEERSKDKEIDKLVALISLSSTGYENQRIGNVAGARETVGFTVMQKSEIQCYNCKEFGHVAKEYAADSRPIFDSEPVQKVSTDDHYNVFAIESEHPEQSESIHDTYTLEQDKHNVTIDSLDMSYDKEQIDQNDDDDDLANERELLASLIEKLKYEIDDSKNRNKFLETSNKVLVEKLKGVIPTTSVSRPQLKSNPQGDRVMHNNSQGKKQEVEDQHRSVKLFKNKTSVTACNDSLNAKTLNVKSISAKCDSCVLIDKHAMCVLKYVAKPIKKTIASESNKKPRNFTRKLYEHLVEIVLFIIDSGCSKHMTKNLKLLINFVEKFLGTVKFGNDQNAPILEYGDLVQGAVMINRFYYVEGLNHNLFSVGQFCDADLEVAFRKSTCYIRDLKGNDLLTGSRGMELYSITLQDTNCPNPICLMAKATSSQAWLWHRRLSHLNFDTINLLSKNDIVVGLPKLKFIKDHLCSSCELGKAKRKSFHTKLTPSLKRRLQLLHIDLCGPMRVASINGKRYVLVIVDDYSRYTWTHFLRSKDETPKNLHAYFAAEGIHHQTFVARTPEQNGVVKRRNRTLVEAARTMLSAAKVSLFLWAKAIATACFTQNCSLVIPRHEKTPYHIINNRKPSVKFFHIFGSLCYIIRDGENLDKMKEKVDECIFVGYSTQSRAYRVFNKRTRRMALEHDSLSLAIQRQANVPQADRTV
nr:retrovirus-related Pol polyprotein from transposon TNT 1-94 [Tanacetum cinerariifolium]